MFYVDKIIRHVSKLEPEDENYAIAEEFIMSNLHGHTFPDTSTRQVESQLKDLKVKFRVHNFPAKDLERLDYLQSTFLSMPLKTTNALHKKAQAYSGIDSAHHSVLRLLLLLSQSPTTTTIPRTLETELPSLFLEREADTP